MPPTKPITVDSTITPIETCAPIEACALEERILFSASPLALLADTVASHDPIDAGAVDDLAAFLSHSMVPRSNSGDAHEIALDQSVPSELPSYDGERHELVVIDSAVPDFEVLLHHLETELENANGVRTELLILDSNTGGVQAVSDVLLSDSDWDAVHIVSHGSAGQVQLGRDVLSMESQSSYAEQLERWGEALDADADLVLYGCDVAATDPGRAFLEQLSHLTGADIAASDNPTGHLDLGGDWEFEYQIGNVTSELVFSVDVQTEWRHTLDVTSGLVGHFDFENGADTIAADSSAFGNDGTLINFPTWSRERITGSGSLDFGSDNEKNAFVEVPDTDTYDWGDGDFTVAFWYNSTGLPTEKVRLVGSSDASDAFEVTADPSGDLTFSVDGDNTTTVTRSGAFIADGDWHHVAATRVGFAFTIYIDHTVWESVWAVTSPVGNINPDAPITIGAASSTTAGFDGLLDDVRLYDRGLSASDIGELMDLGGRRITVDTSADYTVLDPNYGDTTSISALLLDKGADDLISLREAIDAANNSAGFDTIGFDILGAGPHTINVIGQLQITDAVHIDGMSEPDATYGADGFARPVIELNGGGLGLDGLELAGDSRGSIIEGLIINNFQGSGINVQTQENTFISNFIGTDPTGVLAKANNGSGIAITNASGNVIGGNTAADANIILGNGQDGIRMFGSSAFSNEIYRNYIGVNTSGDALGNRQNGINVTGGAFDNRIGGVDPSQGNVIAGNDLDGVVIDGNSQSNNIQSNSIYGNTDQAIDLGNDGFTANDPGDSDTGANSLQNHPLITDVTFYSTSILQIEIDYDTSSFESGSTYSVQFFASSADGQAERLLLTQNGVNPTARSLRFSGTLHSGEYITAIATQENTATSSADSSEVSAGFLYVENSAPVLDLDADDSRGSIGLGFETTFTSGAGPVNLTDLDTVASDNDHTTFNTVVITITNLLDGADESLAVTLPSAAWDQTYDSATGQLRIAPAAGSTHADWERVLQTVTYNNTALSPTPTTRTISFLVHDGVDDNSAAITNSLVTIQPATNNAPYFATTPIALGKAIDTSASGVTSATAADIDGDGDLDLVASLGETGNVVWYENDGDGSFPTANQIVTGSSEPKLDVASSDIDSDGDIDLIIAGHNATSSSVTVHSNDGAGNFSSQIIDDTSQGAIQIEVGDIDGDGDMDIAAAFSSSNEIAWYENLGSSTWKKETIGTAPGVTSIELADLNGDGNLDLVSTHSSANALVWYENKGGSPIRFNSYATALIQAYDVEATDLDGDGDIDIGYVGRMGDVGWYENDGASVPDFTKHELGTYGAPGRISSADLNGDGLTELMVSLENDGGFVVFDNHPDGRFHGTTFSVGTLPSSIQAADFDGDSDLDVYTTDSETSEIVVHENVRNGFTVAIVNEDSQVVIAGVSIGDSDAGSSPLGVTIDVTDGVVDLAATDGLAFSSGDGEDDTSMTFTGTVAEINAAVGAMTFTPDSDFNGLGSIRMVVNDLGNTGSGGPMSSAKTFNVNVLPINDAPRLDTSGDLRLTKVVPNDPNPPGDTIAEILASDGGDRITDIDSGAVEGIALTFIDASLGTWEYRVNGASDWTAVPNVTDSNALLLAPDSELRLLPSSTHSGATLMRFRAWDQTSGMVGSLHDTSSNGGTTAFSVESKNAIVDVGGKGIAPVLDLDLNNSSGAPGNQNSATYSVGGAPTTIADVDATITDADSSTLTRLIVTLVNPQDGVLEFLSVDTSGNPNLSNEYRAADGSLTITGVDTLAAYEQVLRTITYENTSTSPNTSTRTLNVVAFDGANFSSSAQSLISILDDVNAPTRVTNTGSETSEGVADVIHSSELSFRDDIQSSSNVTYSIDSDPTRGVIALSSAPTVAIRTFTQAQIDAGELIYVHDGSETTSDRFTFSVEDGQGNSTSTQTFNIAVTPVNDTPVTTDDSFTTQLNRPIEISTQSLLSNDTDADGDQLTVTQVGSSGHGRLSTTADGSIKYTPNAGFVGTDSFTYDVSDGNGGTSQSSVTITILDVNPPLANDDSITIREDTQFTATLGVNDLLLNDSGSAVTVVPTPVTPPAHGSLLLNSDGSFTYTPDADFHGDDRFVYQVIDSNGKTANANVSITVTSQNDGPVANDENYQVNEGATMASNVLLNDSDVDGDLLTATVIYGPVNGSLRLAPNGSFSYSHDGSETTSDSFTYQITDTHGAASVATATIHIAPVNDAPVAAVPGAVVTSQNTPITLSTANGSGLSIHDVDANGAPIIVTVSAADGTLSLASTTGLTFATGTGRDDPTVTFIGTVDDIQNAIDGLRFNPRENFVGNTSIRLTIDDQGNFGSGGAKITNAQVILQVQRNDAPVSRPDSFSLPVGTSKSGNVLLNDIDSDSSDLTAILFEAPPNGSLDLRPDGSFTYQPDAGFVGADSFTYAASDSVTMSDATIVEFNVTPVIDPSTETTSSSNETTGTTSESEATPSSTTSTQSVDLNETLPPNETVLGLTTTDLSDAAPSQVFRRGTQSEPQQETLDLPSVASRIETNVEPSPVETISARSLEGSFDRSEVTVDAGVLINALPDLAMIGSPLRPASWLWSQMNDVNEQLREDSDTLVLGASMTTVTATALSVGYVLWSLRSSYLIASMMSSIPAWKRVDPLPILSITSANRKRRYQNATPQRESLLEGIKNDDNHPVGLPAFP